MRIRFGAFKTDCDACDALCCKALTILNMNDLGQTKPAGTDCPHLGEDQKCTIYGKRSMEGFTVCGKYDCLGAGPLTTQLFAKLKTDIDASLLIPEVKAALLAKWEQVRQKSFQDLQTTFLARRKRPAYNGQPKTAEQKIEAFILEFVNEIKDLGVRLENAKSEFE